jgi:hypothetical protein
MDHDILRHSHCIHRETALRRKSLFDVWVWTTRNEDMKVLIGESVEDLEEEISSSLAFVEAID